MIYKLLRYASTAMLAYFSMTGAKHLFLEDGDVSFPVLVSIYLIFGIAPLLILFFGVGASDVDIPRKSESHNLGRIDNE